MTIPRGWVTKELKEAVAIPANEYYFSGETVSGDVMTGFVPNKKYIGIFLNNYSEYFSAAWDYRSGDENIQPMITYDTVVGGKLKSRGWLLPTEKNKIKLLWQLEATPSSAENSSIGGYRLKSFKIGTNNVDLSSVTGNISDIINSQLTSVPKIDIVFTYEKILTIQDKKLGDVVYKINYSEDVILNLSSEKRHKASQDNI